MTSSFPRPAAPVKVDIPTNKSAVLVLDCSQKALDKPSFKSTVPHIKDVIEKARRLSVPVIYTVTMRLGTDIVEDIKPKYPEDLLLETYGGDKFFQTRLDEALSKSGVRYPVITGMAINGAVLYTTFESIMRGYTPVVVADCVSSDHPEHPQEIQQWALWQLLNSPGRMNPTNKPLAPFSATLTDEPNLNFV